MDVPLFLAPLAIVTFLVWLFLRHSRPTSDSSQRKRTDGASYQVHSRKSDQLKNVTLSQIEQKSLYFKLREELLKENRELKAKLYQRERELDELKVRNKHSDEVIDEMNNSASEKDRNVHELKSELRKQDDMIEWSGMCLKQTQVELEDKEQVLEETCHQLTVASHNLEETCAELEERSRKLEEMQRSLERQQQVEAMLRESLRQSEIRVKKGKDTIAGLRDEVADCKKQSERDKIDHESKMREKQKEKNNLIASHQRELNAQKERHALEVRQMNEKVNASNKRIESLEKQAMGYDKALEVLKKEKDGLVTEHNKLLERFEASVRELDVCTEKLRIQGETRKDVPSQKSTYKRPY